MNRNLFFAVLEKCQILKEYGMFIDTVNKYQKKNVQEPYKCAIEECIEKGILSEYLQRKGSEVRNMLIAEYDYDMDIEVQREEAYEDGMKAGELKGEIKGQIKGENRINGLHGRLIKDNRIPG